jgi:hypothetical protein
VTAADRLVDVPRGISLSRELSAAGAQEPGGRVGDCVAPGRFSVHQDDAVGVALMDQEVAVPGSGACGGRCRHGCRQTGSAGSERLGGGVEADQRIRPLARLVVPDDAGAPVPRRSATAPPRLSCPGSTRASREVVRLVWALGSRPRATTKTDRKPEGDNETNRRVTRENCNRPYPPT